MALGEDELLALLNSAPVINGRIVDRLDDPRMSALRDSLHAVIRAEAAPAVLAGYLKDVRQTPSLGDSGILWNLDGPAAQLPYAEYVLEWSRVERELPGRLRACANPDCNKFLIDHSKPNTARWCSMATCGNRMKARRHSARQAQGAPGE
jgi:hypothetical protein